MRLDVEAERQLEGLKAELRERLPGERIHSYRADDTIGDVAIDGAGEFPLHAVAPSNFVPRFPHV